MSTKKTFEPSVIGGIEVSNRIFRSATHEMAALDSRISEELIEMYRNLSCGGVGLIITGNVGVSQTDQPDGTMVFLTDDNVISGLQTLTKTVHENGSKIVAQLNHVGSQLFAPPAKQVYGPTDVADPISGICPTPLTIEQIPSLVADFGDAAFRAKQAGFDGVQIHGAHGYLLSKFLSPLFNTRTDEYGGTVIKRARIVMEIVYNIKKKCGQKYPVWIKLNCSDFHPDDKGLTEEDFRVIARQFAKNGIDAIEVSGGTFNGAHTPFRSKKYSAYHLEPAKTLAEEIDVSVILVGGLRKIDLIDEILAETQIEAVSMSRPLIREPELVKRWSEGDRTDANCVACNGCYNPNGTQCFFKLNKEERTQQREVMKLMGLSNE